MDNFYKRCDDILRFCKDDINNGIYPNKEPIEGYSKHELQEAINFLRTETPYMDFKGMIAGHYTITIPDGTDFIKSGGYQGEEDRANLEALKSLEKEKEAKDRSDVEYKLKIKSYDIDIKYKFFMAILGVVTIIFGYCNFTLRQEYKDYKSSTQDTIKALSKELERYKTISPLKQKSDSSKTK